MCAFPDYPLQRASTSWSISTGYGRDIKMGRTLGCTCLTYAYIPPPSRGKGNPRMRLGGIVEEDIITTRKNKERCAMRRGVGVYKSERGGEWTTPKEESSESCLLTSESPCPSLTYFWRENESQWWGETKGEIEIRNGGMKIFIGVLRVADVSTLGMIDDREERWMRRKSILILTRTACGSIEFETYS